MRLRFAVVIAFLLACSGLVLTQSRTTLDIYAIDAEGGKATLYVSPSGESLLLDAGSGGGRDATRIAEAAKLAGITQIDYLLITHYDGDHVGGVKDLADRLPIKHFVDYGPRQAVPTAPALTPAQMESLTRSNDAYMSVVNTVPPANHLVLKAGDTLPIKGIDVHMVSSKGTVLTKAIADGGKSNPRCGEFKPHPVDTTENYNTLGTVISAFGRFRALDLGDLTWNLENKLVCPNNLIGTVDLYMVTHHGLARSSEPLMVAAVAPRVAIMNNGPRKGGAVETWDTLRATKTIQDVWTLHYSEERPMSENFEEKADPGGPKYNAPEDFIANLDRTPPPPAGTPAPGQGRGQAGAARGPQQPPHVPAYVIKVSVRPDGSFTITNTRNGFSKQYPAGPKR
jgi:beta-lactamase superfamily II metal-dependent hydrolase